MIGVGFRQLEKNNSIMENGLYFLVAIRGADRAVRPYHAAVEGEELLEIGYLFQRACWHRGYAAEAAAACKEYAFRVLKADSVCSIIRDTNTASQKVAVRNGMIAADTWTKHYRGVDMPHIRYTAERKRWEKKQ